MKLSVIISNRNDIVLLNITLNSVLEAFKLIDCKSEIVVVDNSDKEMFELIKDTFPAFIKHNKIKLIHKDNVSFTKARMDAARAAKGEYLFCIDSHMLLGCNTLRRSIEFMDSNKDKPIGFGHPPMRWAKNGPLNIKQSVSITARGSIYAKWAGKDFNKDSKMFWKPMPWICDREWYLNKLKGYGSHAEYSISWGGAELLQQIKSWILGYENWYIHTDPAIHIGPYSKAIYNTGQTKRRAYVGSGNYPEGFGVILALMVLGGEKEGYKQVKLAQARLRKIHNIRVEKWWPKAVELGKAEHEWLMSNRKYNLNGLLKELPWKKE